MTSKIKVDNINKVSDDTNIIKKCGTTTTIGSGASNPIVVDGSAITLGRCGGTVALASGATQTGFGRTGTVDWITTPKTATFTAVSGEGYFCNTSGGAFTVNLPAGVAGAIVSISDYANTFGTNKITISANGSDKINGIAFDYENTTNGVAITLVFVDSTRGWKNVDGTTINATGVSDHIVACVSGSCNTQVTHGDYKIAIFKGPGTFCVSQGGTPSGSNTVEYMVVAGGGGDGGYGAGGGGAGGWRSRACTTPTANPLNGPAALPVTAQGYPIVVGAGGGSSPTANGSNSSFSTITSTGGGVGSKGFGTSPPAGNSQGSPGGSGGGGGSGPSTPRDGGSGNTPPVNPSQGKDGGDGTPPAGSYSSGGGGGASACGTNGVNPGGGGDGGAGAYLADDFIGPTAPSYGTPGPVGSSRYFAGGGGGATANVPAPSVGQPGAGGGGKGGLFPSTSGSGGTVNTGGGAGGNNNTGCTSVGGGSGIIMIRYKFQN